MAHSNNIISQIKLPNGTAYEIHDAQAIHSVEELGLSQALRFMGVKKTEADVLALTTAKIGDVWLVDADENVADGVNAKQVEYVCVVEVSGTANANAWEKLGNIHDAASSNHTHNVTVTGENAASTVTGSVTVPTVSKTQKYLTATNAAPDVTPTADSVLGAGTTFTVSGGVASTTKLKASVGNVAVAGNGTAAAITGFGTHTTDAALGVDATFKVSGGAATTQKLKTTSVKQVSTNTDVTIPNVTANETVTASKVKSAGSKTAGSAAAWSASVTNGVLSFDFTPNVPTAVTLPTFDSVTATNTTLGTSLVASKVGTGNVTVATGAIASDGTGSAVVTGVSAVSVAVDSADAVSAITALGTPTTANALTGVKVATQPTVTLVAGTTGDVSVATGVGAISVSANGNDLVDALTDVDVAPSAITLTNNANNVAGAVPVVSAVEIGSASASLQNGSAAAQKWTQKSGSTGAPV